MKIIKFLDDTNELEIEATTEWARTLGEFLDWAIEGDYAYIEMFYPVGEEDIFDNLILKLKDIELPDNILCLSDNEYRGAASIVHVYQTVSELAFQKFAKNKYDMLLEDLKEPSKQYRAYRDQRTA